MAYSYLYYRAPKVYTDSDLPPFKTETQSVKEGLITEGTRWNVGIEEPNGKVTAVYGHYDGYPQWVGKILKSSYSNSSKVITIEAIGDKTNTIRSPSSKYYNAQAMLLDQGFNPKNEVINTGIVGANKEHLDKLKYFDNFEKDLKLMTRLKSDTSIFPKKIVDFFGYDNETLFAFKLNQYNVPVQWLDYKWHYFLVMNILFLKEQN